MWRVGIRVVFSSSLCRCLSCGWWWWWCLLGMAIPWPPPLSSSSLSALPRQGCCLWRSHSVSSACVGVVAMPVMGGFAHQEQLARAVLTAPAAEASLRTHASCLGENESWGSVCRVAAWETHAGGGKLSRHLHWSAGFAAWRSESRLFWANGRAWNAMSNACSVYSSVRSGDSEDSWNYVLSEVVFDSPRRCTLRLSRERGRLMKCFADMAELGSVVGLEWRPALDNLLLLSSIALAYVAGIVTPAGTNTFSSSWRPEKVAKSLSKTFRKKEKQHAANREYGKQERFCVHEVWNGIQNKLSSGYFASDVLDNENIFSSSKLSLQAILKGPRLRLLSTAAELLHKEVDKLREMSNSLGSNWTELSSNMLCRAVISVCRSWLIEEHSLSNIPLANLTGTVIVNVLDSILCREATVEGNAFLQWKSLLMLQLESLQGNNVMESYLARSGKHKFYADFLHLICFGFVRPGSFSDIKVLLKHSEDILEDMVVALADGAAVVYLELSSAGNAYMELPSVILPSMSSTRALEKFRNEVAIRGWLDENFLSVMAMFEDRFDLWTLKKCTKERPDQANNGQFRFLRKNVAEKPTSDMQLSELLLIHCELPVKRARELRALSGWRYYYSLFLEFSDIISPLLRVFLCKLGEGLSFLLVCLIGRSLGLIYKGIKQSIGWSSN